MSGDIFKNVAFLNYLNKKENPIPLAMSLDVTNNCNFRCCHCYIKDTFGTVDENMSFEKILDLINQMADYGVASLYLSGGEPFTREDFVDIVEYAKKRNLNVYIKSNGYLLTDDLIDRLKKCEVNDIQISVYGMNDEMYKLVTKTNHPNQFKRIKYSIEKLLSAGILTKLRYVVLKENYNGCLDFIKYCKELNLPDDSFFHAVDIHPTTECNLKPLAHAIDIKQQKELIDDIYEINPNYLKKIYRIPHNYKKCNVGRNTIHICNNGDVHPCPGFPIMLGNVYFQSYKKIWENSSNLNQLRNLSVESIDCFSCEDNSFCVGNCLGVIFNWNKQLSFTKKNLNFCTIKKSQIEILKLAVKEGKL